MTKYGYIRVSTREQNEDRQRLAMDQLDIPPRNIFADKQSGKDFDRPQYQRLVRKLRRDKDLMGTFLSDIVLQVLSFVAENERANLRQRQAEGIAAAKARGVRFGRPPRPLPENFHSLHRAWRAKTMTLRQAAGACGLPVATFYSKARKLEQR